MRIGILQADSVVDQFQPAHGNYPAMIEKILGRAAADLGLSVTFATYDVEHGSYPESPDECSGYVITGSKKSVYDDLPWIGVLKDYVRDLYAARVRMVGICFGHQLIAEALGGKTEKAAGWGVGVHHSTVYERAGFMEPALNEYSLLVSHQDQVVTLPEGATLLAGSEFCPNSLYCIGDDVLAMQGHPEFTKAYSSDLIHWREEILGPETFSAGLDSLEYPLSQTEVPIWMMKFLSS